MKRILALMNDRSGMTSAEKLLEDPSRESSGIVSGSRTVVSMEDTMDLTPRLFASKLSEQLALVLGVYLTTCPSEMTICHHSRLLISASKGSILGSNSVGSLSS